MSSDSKRPLVLVADDNAVNRKIISAMLDRLGYDCNVVENGQQAVDAMQQQVYQLVLMDCQMPVMDGYVATTEIRNSAVMSNRVPIIALSANGISEHQELCKKAGMDDYLAKPIHLEELRAKLLNWIR